CVFGPRHWWPRFSSRRCPVRTNRRASLELRTLQHDLQGAQLRVALGCVATVANFSRVLLQHVEYPVLSFQEDNAHILDAVIMSPNRKRDRGMATKKSGLTRRGLLKKGATAAAASAAGLFTSSRVEAKSVQGPGIVTRRRFKAWISRGDGR